MGGGRAGGLILNLAGILHTIVNIAGNGMLIGLQLRGWICTVVIVLYRRHK